MVHVNEDQAQELVEQGELSVSEKILLESAAEKTVDEAQVRI